MNKGRRVLSVAFTLASFAVAVFACDGDDGGSTFGGPDAGPATGDTGPQFNTDGKSEQDVDPAVNCTPSLPASFKPEWKPPTRAQVCTAKDLADYYDTCLAKAGAPDAGAICQAWLDANKDCGECIEPDDNSGPIQWHRDRKYYTLNVAGCMAIERGEPEDGKCPSVYHASFQCQRESCADCFFQTSAEFADFQKCQAAARATGCAKYHAKINPTCGLDFNDPDGGAYACFRPAGEQEREHFVRVEGVFCGP